MKTEIKVVVQLKSRFISVNSLYKSRISYIGGKPRAVVYKNPKAIDIENEIREQLRAINFSNCLDWLRDTKGFKLHIQFIFKKGITNSDTSNYFKNVEDIFTRFIKEDLGIENYDDSKHIEVSAVKSIIPKSKHEYACIYLTESKFNVRMDQEDKPKRIFLGGTCGKIDWRKDLISELEKRGLEYFNPVVPDWTPDCIERENIEKSEKCDTHLYIITPETKGPYSVAEIIDSTWRCVSGDIGFVYFGILGNRSMWDEGMYRSLEAVLEMVKKISDGNSRVKVGVIDNVIDVLKL